MATLSLGLWLGLSAVGIFDLLVLALLSSHKLIQKFRQDPTAMFRMKGEDRSNSEITYVHEK